MATQIQRKINVLEMHSSFGYAGGQRTLVSICKYLNRDIFNVSAAAYREGGVQEKRLHELGVPFVVSSDVATLLGWIQEKQIDVLHLHRSGGTVPLESAIIEGAKRVNPNIVIVEKNVFGKYDSVSDALIDGQLFQSMMHVNERYLPASGKMFDGDRMRVLYNPVDGDSFEHYRCSVREIQNYKHKLGIDNNDFVIGRIGRPDLAKWSDLLIEMMPYALQRIPSICLVIVGLPASRRRWIEGAPWKDRVTILEEMDDERDVHQFYQLIDVLAHSSKIGECNGNTINEAMYWGKPVVVNSTPKKDNGQLEQVEHMKTGIVANRPATYARALAYLAAHSEERQRMGVAAHTSILSHNHPAPLTRQLEEFFLELLAKKGYGIDPSVMAMYKGVIWKPTAEAVTTYRQEYKKRCATSFGAVSLGEKIESLIQSSRRWYWKVRDMMSHRWGSGR